MQSTVFAEFNWLTASMLQEPHKGVILQSQTREEWEALLPRVIDETFKGEL